VVVAVDSGWLLQSLEAYYERQFHRRSNWESKPQHYLEKIFQIPFALPPMEKTGFRNLVLGMLRRHVSPLEGQDADHRNGSHAITPLFAGNLQDPPSATPSPTSPNGHTLTDDSVTKNGANDGPPHIDEPTTELTPRNMQIEQFELDFVETL